MPLAKIRKKTITTRELVQLRRSVVIDERRGEAGWRSWSVKKNAAKHDHQLGCAPTCLLTFDFSYRCISR